MQLERRIDELAVDDGVAGGRVVADEARAGHAERLDDAAVHRVEPWRAGDLLDDLAEHDVVGVGVSVRGAGRPEPAGGFRHRDQLGSCPLTLRIAAHERVVEVLVEAAGVLQQLAGRDLVRTGQVGEVLDDVAVEVQLSFFGQLQHDDRDEALGDAADAPRHVERDGCTGGVRGLRAGGGFGNGAVGGHHGDAGADELNCVEVSLQDLGQQPFGGGGQGGRGRGRRLRGGGRRRCGRRGG